jgi:hypothetical protein
MELQELRERIRQWKAGVPHRDAPKAASPKPAAPIPDVAEESFEIESESDAEPEVGRPSAPRPFVSHEISPAVAAALAQTGPDAGAANTTAEILDPGADLDVVDDSDIAAETIGAEDESAPVRAPEPEDVAIDEDDGRASQRPAAVAAPSAADVAAQQAAAQAIYAQLTPEHLAALQQYGQQLYAQGYSPEQIAAAQFHYAQQMVIAMQQQAAGGSSPPGGAGA